MFSWFKKSSTQEQKKSAGVLHIRIPGNVGIKQYPFQALHPTGTYWVGGVSDLDEAFNAARNGDAAYISAGMPQYIHHFPTDLAINTLWALGYDDVMSYSRQEIPNNYIGPDDYYQGHEPDMV